MSDLQLHLRLKRHAAMHGWVIDLLKTVASEYNHHGRIPGDPFVDFTGRWEFVYLGGIAFVDLFDKDPAKPFPDNVLRVSFHVLSMTSEERIAYFVRLQEAAARFEISKLMAEQEEVIRSALSEVEAARERLNQLKGVV